MNPRVMTAQPLPPDVNVGEPYQIVCGAFTLYTLHMYKYYKSYSYRERCDNLWHCLVFVWL